METRVQYFDCLCRTCMNKVEASSHDGTTIPQQQWLSIFDIFEECGALRIAELLSDAVPQIVVQPSDELPKKICTECLQRLLTVYRFQQMCVQSDKEMHELLSKEQTVLKTPRLEGSIKGETETNDAETQPLKELRCNSTLHNLHQPSIQEAFAEVTVQTIEQEAAESSAANHLQDKTKLLENCNNSQGEFEEFIKNEPIEDDEKANSEYSDGDTIHSTISVTKEEVLPIEFEDQQVNDASSRHKCHLCDKSYKRREYLTRHLNDHKKKPNNGKVYCYACHLCSESYKNQQHLSKHLTLAHSKDLQRYTCDVCNKSFASSSGLRHHIPKHTGERSYVPPECGKSLTAQSILAEQRTTHAEDKPYERPYCLRRFNSKANASRHKTVVHERAAKQFRLKHDLTKYKRIHTSKEKPHKCDLCEKRFTLMQHLQLHIRTHTGEKPYKCKYCERGCASSTLLRCHLRSHLGKNIHRCRFCPLAFPSLAEMRLHLTSHKNEDPEVRERNLKALQEEEAKLVVKFSKEKSKGQSTEEQQQKKLSNKEIEQHSTDILAEQRTTHAEDKPYERPYCLRRFNSKANASRHKTVVHERAAKQFRLKHDLTKYKRIHTSKEKPHKCDLCEKRFTLMQHLQLHIRTHTGEKPYKCKYCERGCASSTLLRCHLRSHLGKNIHRCRFCPLAFPSLAEMRLHLTSHKNEDPEVRERNLKALQEEEAKLVVKFSKEKSKGQSTEEQQQKKLSNKEIEQHSTDILAEQRTTHTEDKPYERPYCLRRFNSKANASRHKAVVHERAAKPHQCDICEKQFRLKHDLTKHKRIHTSKEKPHKCDLCEKRFTLMQHLQLHIRTHTSEKPYKCKYCERGCASSTLLNCHLRSHLGKNIHRCKFCPLAFPTLAEKRLHLTSHKNEDPEVRERNLKALQEEEAKLVLKFSKEKSKGQSTEEQQQKKLSNKEIEQHSTDIPAEQRTTDAEDKPYECPYCPLRFRLKRNVSIHKTIHEGIKPHKCDICGNKFRIAHDLTKHKRIHSTEKPHKCDICERRFFQKQQLKVHIRSHTLEKPYKCKYCEHAFSASSTLRYHLRSHLGKNIHRCKFCPLAFPSNAEMRLHFTSHKNEDPEVRERNLKALQEEEAQLKLKFSKEISKAPSTEEQQQEKLCNKDIEQPSRE